MYRKKLLFLAIAGLFAMSACSPAKKLVVPVATPVVVPPPAPPAVEEIKEDPVFAQVFKNYPGLADSLLLHRKDRNVQIIYTEINRGADGTPTLKKHYFNRNDAAYFYPASTVKLPVALLALQKLNELGISGLNKNTTMITEANYSGQTPVYNDPNTADGKPTIAQYVKKILLVSDNDAYNRLYEWPQQSALQTADAF